MFTLIRNGGAPMIFVLLFGLMALGGGLFAVFQKGRLREGYVRWMLVATLGATLSGTASDVGMTLVTVSRWKSEGKAQWVDALLEGLSESMSPGIMGFSLIGMTALAMAIARRRADAREG